MEELQIKGELLFEFTSFPQWVNKATSWTRPYKYSPIVFLDKNNDVCHIGEDFMNARDKDLFPVRVYLLRRAV